MRASVRPDTRSTFAMTWFQSYISPISTMLKTTANVEAQLQRFQSYISPISTRDRHPGRESVLQVSILH
ncbi:MAG: hypothetical protein ACP5G6_08620 [Conexivisphaera sp.]